MVVVTLFNGEEQQIITRGFYFVSSENNHKFVQFDPPLKRGRISVEYAYFESFEMDTISSLKIMPQNIRLKITQNLEIRFVTPLPISIPDSLNCQIPFSDYPQNVILFDSESSEFIGIIRGTWNNLKERIETFLRLRHIPCKNIRVGPLPKETSNLITIEEFFRDPPNNVYKVSFIPLLLKSDDEDTVKIAGLNISLGRVPTLPKAIARAGAVVLSSGVQSRENLETWRRLTYSAVNCGVVLPLLEQIPLESIDFSEFDLNPYILNLAEAKSDLTPLRGEFITELERRRNFVDNDSNEATLCGLFWFPLLTRCLERTGIPPINFRIQYELETKGFLHPQTKNKIDFAATIDLGDAKLPILIVEAGIETVPEGYLHKDSSKIQCLLSVGTYTMAYKLIGRGQMPELAVTFGVLIGGSKCQLLVARPVIREMTDGTSEIYVNISYHDHWGLDIIEGPKTSPNCRGACCFSGSHSGTGTDLTDQTLKCLQEFINLVRKQMDLILRRDNSTSDRSNRRYRPKRDQVTISSARSSATQNTPLPNRPKPVGGDAPESLSPTSRVSHRQRKYSTFEADVYSYCAAYFGNCFPRVYKLERVETENGPCFDYTFEHLIPFVDPDATISSEYFNVFEPEVFVGQALRFSIHILFELHILHDKLKIVHGDLKPTNIMFSQLDNVWKIIDFDRSAPIDESSKTERTAGTKDYWPPECPNGKGIFTTASDMFSFSLIIENVFWTFLLKIACEEERLEKGCFVLTRLMDQLQATDPKNRPTALEALRTVVKGLKEFDKEGKIEDHIIEAASLLVTLNISRTAQTQI